MGALAGLVATVAPSDVIGPLSVVVVVLFALLAIGGTCVMVKEFREGRRKAAARRASASAARPVAPRRPADTLAMGVRGDEQRARRIVTAAMAELADAIVALADREGFRVAWVYGSPSTTAELVPLELSDSSRLYDRTEHDPADDGTLRRRTVGYTLRLDRVGSRSTSIKLTADARGEAELVGRQVLTSTVTIEPATADGLERLFRTTRGA